jgi:tripartite ATP-independent transporter DctM subunit
MFIVWVVLLGLLGVPVVFALAFGPFMDLLSSGKSFMIGTLIQRALAGIGKFELLAVPLFILAGEIMNRGGITERIVRFSHVFVGRLRGGLAHVNILASILFAGLSGSAVADTSALGSILIPSMVKDGYSKEYSTAVTAASSIIGPIIPPSIIMIVYSYVMEVSIGALFASGIIPGILMGVALMLMTAALAEKHHFPPGVKLSLQESFKAIYQGILPVLTPFIILGGILSGVITPTEAAIVAVAYAFFLSLVVFRTTTLKESWNIFKKSSVQAGVILLVIGSAAMFGWILTLSRIPQNFAEFITTITTNKYVFLLLVNLFLFVVGMFLDAGPAILILGPILGHAIKVFGINPTHFAVVMCVNLTIGLATPPFGLVLFAASTISGLPVITIAKTMVPYYAVHLAVVLLISFVPEISLWLPRIFGLPV